MVLLTMTPAIVRAIAKAREVSEEELSKLQLPAEPSLAEPNTGNPISHSQLIDISKLLKKHVDETGAADAENGPLLYTLDSLLKGSDIYITPPPPKKEPLVVYADQPQTPEYKALMERLRREEEARAYERMLHPVPAIQTFAQRFPTTPHAHFNSIGGGVVEEDDDVNYNEVHRQIILIINVLITIIACSAFIWVAARHWSIPRRLGLSMSGSGAIAVAEVVIYRGYVRRVKEAKLKERKKPEIKKIVESWVIDRATDKKGVATSSGSREGVDESIRYRKGKHR
ncbi:hypothetical protein CC78DRAFT_76312 [Lojkania enalia]|uniref:ATPase, vacuolar ER assembly factor, Vma12 n=1 Tax=Lojkania enalia TaxID=147567 RepID=A0A9P4N8Z6_9PLEO|nr:hypothetical protein CC78DRAFT_76312 [Didymosphaeria enalia]